MAKYYLTVVANQKKYRMAREDFKAAYSHKVRKIPKIPAYEQS